MSAADQKAEAMWAAAQLAAEVLTETNDYITLEVGVCESHELVHAFAAASGGTVKTFHYLEGNIEVVERQLGHVHISIASEKSDMANATAFAIGLGLPVDWGQVNEATAVQLDELCGARRLEAA